MKNYEFINSRDIRLHWEKIGYQPTALESAWLVWQSKNHTLREKHTAWKNIISSYGDCGIPAGIHDLPQPSLHRFLEQYMKVETALVSAFYSDEPDTVYSYRFYCEGDSNWCGEFALFHSFDEANAHAKEDFDGPSPKYVEFVKTYIGAEWRQIFVRFNLDGEIVGVDENHYITNEHDDEILNDVFANMWFAFPTPFKKGDLVKVTHGKYRKPSKISTAFALTDICTEYRSNGDGNDMTAYGYFVGIMRDVYYECVHNYMDLEYITGELQNEERMLIPISRYLRDEIELGLLLGAQRVMLCEDSAQMTKSLLNYTEEGKKIAGINK